MVKLTSAFFVVASLALAVFASPIEQRDVNKVKNDLRQVAHDVSALDTTISDLGSTISIVQALGIRTSVATIEKGIDQSTRDVREVTNVSEADGRDIMNEVNGFVPTIVNALKGIDLKQNVFRTIPIRGATELIRQALQDLHIRSVALADALINAAPGDIKTEAMKTKDTVEAAFKKVMDDFSA
ncbi:hypothetical protein AX15_006729 [Amanita polypyramis BW_CC]|nr:hypothetical protein AX15_006729 [Amanita polypyramis BW_CC]